MMLPLNIKMAMQSIKSAKWRSFLTMLGIIVGVASVVTIVSIGEGVRREIIGQIDHLGPNLITVRPGKTVDRDQHGAIAHVDLLQTFGSVASFSENDLQVIRSAPNVGVAVPITTVTGVPTIDDKPFRPGFIVATTPGMPEILNQKIEFGGFFDKDEADHNVAVIGKRVAEQLFQENAPVGRAMTIRDKTFVVRGVFEEFESSPLTPNTDYNKAVFIPYETAKVLTNNQLQIQQVLAKPVKGADTASTTQAIHDALQSAHGGQEDFTILRQVDNLTIANRVLDILTGLISGIAAISLIVGGIGIMNIMLVAVTERTHEIGIRKAIGATNRQIMGQFLVESATISFVGGLIGVIVSVLCNYLIRIVTNLGPVVTWQIILLAIGVALAVGVFFGVTPALKAARKKPIEALREY
jgi:putative ABC transport system permease protein